MKIYAHRGNKSEYPENSLAAFQSAVKLGVEGIELDVHLSKDNEMVVIHDETLDRTTNKSGEVQTLTLAELKQANLLNVDGSVSEELLPTLAEVLNLLDELTFTGDLNIELKTDQNEYQGIEKLVKELIESKPRSYPIIYSSFNWHTINRMKKLEPQGELALLFAQPLMTYQHLIPEIAPHGLHIDFRLVAQLESAYQGDLPLRLWTVNDLADIRNWLLNEERNIEVIMTDYPRQALALRSELASN